MTRKQRDEAVASRKKMKAEKAEVKKEEAQEKA